MKKKQPCSLSILMVALIYLFSAFQQANAATYPVTNLNDAGAGSLRQAILDANANPGADVIDATGVSGIILLTTGQLTVTGDLTINGPGAALLDVHNNVVASSETRRVFDIGNVVASISSITISGGYSSGYLNYSSSLDGAGINNSGQLTITNCVVSGNKIFGCSNCGTFGSGAGINNSGTLTVINSVIKDNEVGYGGDFGTANGGGISNQGTATIQNSTISGNSSSETGGGLFNSGTMNITNSTISNNQAGSGGGLNNGGALTVINTTFSGNSGINGGAIYYYGGAAAIKFCTITNNGGGYGGGIYNSQYSLGGSVAAGVFTISNSILAGNGGDYYFPNDASIPPAGYANLTSLGNNIFGSVDAPLNWTFNGPGDQLGSSAAPINPLLGPLANNGGPTQTHALLAGSPALNAGAAVAGITTDQRGIARPQGSGHDIGAYELEFVPPVISIDNVSLSEGNSGTTTFSFTVSLDAPAGAGGITFDIATADNTATTANSDYVSKSLASQTIPAGSSTYTFDVAVNGDLAVELDETFFVNITNIVGASAGDVQGEGTITNDDLPNMTLTANGPSGTICGENLSVTIKVKDFKDIGTLDFSVNWDATKLELLSYTPLTIDDDAPLNGEFFPAGQLTYTWADGDIDYGVTLADGTTILTLNFKALVNSATGVTVDITGTPTAINASDLNFAEVTVTTENLVSFNIERVFVNSPTVTQPTCAVPTGTIVVNATGSGTLEYSINGGTSWSTINTFGGQAPGNYNIAARLQSNPTCIISYSSNPVVLTAATGCVVVCPKSQGYWKNNPSVWPASALPMMLGTSNTYTKQQLRKILNTAVGTGTKADASLILAHQLIAAKLNIAAGATAPASVTAAITAADVAIGTRLIPMNVRTNTTLGKTMTSLAKTLESFNTGQLNAGCSTLLTTSTMSSGLSMNVVPESFELEQNYPNPFSSVTTIRYVVPVESTVSIAVYNSQGQLMAKLADGKMSAGNHQVRFDASKLAAGIYLYRLQTVDANGQIVMINKKMILSK